MCTVVKYGSAYACPPFVGMIRVCIQGTHWSGMIFDLTPCLEHRRAVERLIEERRAQFQAEKEAELEERKEEERREADRRAIIEQERQRLLQEHASKLLGYLPKVSKSEMVCIAHNTCTFSFVDKCLST